MENIKHWTRRTLALIFGSCGAAVLTKLALQGSDNALIALVGIVGTVIGFYFGAKTGSETPGS